MKHTPLQIALLLFGTLAVYWPTLNNGYVWDDHTNIHKNVTLTQPDALRRIWTTDDIYQYYPLTFTSYYLEYLACGRTFRPEVSHAINIVLHAANAIVLMFLCRSLGLGNWAAWFAAAIFAVHPIQTESVAWATERKNLLSGFFFFSAFLAYARLMRTHRTKDYILALILFLLAGLSKTVTMTLPASLILLERTRNRTPIDRIAICMAPFAALAVCFAVLARVFEHERAGATWLTLNLSMPDRLIIACRVPWHYLQNILLPRSPVFIPPQWKIDSTVAWNYWPVALTTATILALFLARRRFPGLTLLAAGHFLVTLLPASGLVNFVFMRYSFVQDHFQYLAGIGILILLAQFAEALYNRAGRFASRAGAAGVIVAALLISLGTISHWRCYDYSSSEVLWRDTLAKNPTAWIAAYNLGILVARGDDRAHLAEAAELYEQAIRYKSDNPDAYNNLGIIQAKLGHHDRAIDSFEQSLRIWPRNIEARINLARLFSEMGRNAQARLNCRIAAQMAESDGRKELAQQLRRELRRLETAPQRRP